MPNNSNSPLYYYNNKVGIGVLTPTHGKLQIFGNDSGEGIAFSYGAYLTKIWRNSANFYITHGDNVTKGITIYKDGGLGVGYSSSFLMKYKLAINGTSYFANNLTIEGSNKDILIKNTSESESGIRFSDSQDVSGLQSAKIMFNSNTTADNKLNFYIGADYSSTYWKNATTNKKALTIANDGKVGIGTENPQAELAVNGTILAKEVRVSVTDGDWPDYVFSDDYQLKNLNEVEGFINENNHLPDVPSAQAMEEEGVDLAKMNKVLLQKVEELTLYMIQQQKEIEALKAKVNK
ncbi:MAG: hypothetical protein JW717_02185 [Marinilabiliaceae bacterium]|nr:hypothetical protein [Marinilabiliaceae bacterium]